MIDIKDSTGYQFIQDFYGNRTAKRSGVPLMNHINEGLLIMQLAGKKLGYQVSARELEAFAIHPLFQEDSALASSWSLAVFFDPDVVLLAMEYRSVANEFLSDKIVLGETTPPIRLSPLQGVNMMLIGDKVQNRKDFELYHKGSHARSVELDIYFRYWLRALDIFEPLYNELLVDLERVNLR